jgi:hypothetical protein
MGNGGTSKSRPASRCGPNSLSSAPIPGIKINLSAATIIIKPFYSPKATFEIHYHGNYNSLRCPFYSSIDLLGAEKYTSELNYALLTDIRSTSADGNQTVAKC